jgi:hypothetical protein
MAEQGIKRRLGRGSILLLAACAAVALAIGALPVNLFRSTLERKLSARIGAPVTIGAVERDSWFSYTPEIAIRDVRIRQPAWAGPGDMLRVTAARVRLPILKAVFGRGLSISAIRVSGLDANLVRDRDGRSNWSDRSPKDTRESGRGDLSDLIIENGRFTLHDAKRELALAGTVAASAAQGVTVAAAGTFRGRPAQLHAQGAPVVGADPGRPWSFTARLASPILTLAAKGAMAGPLNASAMTLDIAARGTDLKHLDTIIEAGLFGTQPIDLTASVRREGYDWQIDRIAGGVGRSRMSGRATVLKRDGRTKIDAAIRFSQLDFDDLADNTGLAAATALREKTGPRVIPNTRIDLSKMGPTDGTVRVRADRLLFRGDSVFRSLTGTLTLDHRDLRITNFVAGLVDGRMTGAARVDSRASIPTFSTDLRIEGMTLEALVGAPDDVAGPMRGRVRLSGRGDTIREALAHADGKAAFVATGGTIKKTIAYVLGQDLGGALGQALGKGGATVPLRCLVADFRTSRGVLTPAPLIVDSGVSVGEGKGRIVLDGETIAMTVAGQTRGRGVLRITDPIRIGGTLTQPAISVAGISANERPKAKVALKVLGRSIGSALGLRKDAPQPPRGPAPAVNCNALAAAALR